jgi:hypothetical protein
MRRSAVTVGSLAVLLSVTPCAAEEEGGSGYRERQVPGLNEAASKIFFTERPWSVSASGELNGVFPVKGERDRSSGDLELYYEGLTRLTGYLGLRPADNIAFTLEAQVEYLDDGKGENKTEFNPEFYFDFLGNEHFNMRFGLSPLHIGYINNNDEPILFYSVNRPESERLVIPTEWIEFGLHAYGGITEDVHYALALTNGPEASEFHDATWIRGGKEGRIDLHSSSSIAINPQIEYTGTPGLTLSLSGYTGRSGQGETIDGAGGREEVKARVSVVSGYARWDWKALRLIAMGAHGWLDETEKVYRLTEEKTGRGQVLGSRVYGLYVEAGWDILHGRSSPGGRGGDSGEFGWFGRRVQSLPVFARIERLDTHARVEAALAGFPWVANDLLIAVVGINYKRWEHLVFKANYQIRKSYAAGGNPGDDSDVVEVGIGFSL